LISGLFLNLGAFSFSSIIDKLIFLSFR
jgi:hypothetical protein